MAIQNDSSTASNAEQLADAARTPLALAFLLGPVCLTGLIVVLLAASAAGIRPLWPEIDYTVSEAVYMRDRGAVMELMKKGHSLQPRYRVRDGLARAFDVPMTPMEAAVATGEVFMVEFLQQAGVLIASEERVELVCLAIDRDAPDITRYLLAGDAMPDCTTVALPWSRVE